LVHRHDRTLTPWRSIAAGDPYRRRSTGLRNL
jgi:hypothetical protein